MSPEIILCMILNLLIYYIKQIDSQRGIMLKVHGISKSPTLWRILRSGLEIFPTKLCYQAQGGGTREKESGFLKPTVLNKCVSWFWRSSKPTNWKQASIAAGPGFFLLVYLAETHPITSQVFCWVWGQCRAWELLRGEAGFCQPHQYLEASGN